MLSLWVAFIIGIVEGLTEFLPVSSTGHMILASSLLNISEQDELYKSFEVIIQFGAILAAVIIYWKRILSLFGLRKVKTTGPQMNLIHVLVAIVPTMLLAFVSRHFIKDHLFSPYTVVIGLVLGGIFMLIAEKFQPRVTADNVDEITYKQAFLIGVSQFLSLWPGFSRSGSTMAGGMLAGTSRAAAADFTFIIAIPIMTAAAGYELLQSYHSLSSDSLAFFAVGFIVSFVVAYLAVVTFIKFVQKVSLTYFAYYRFLVAIIFWLFLLK